MNVLQKLVQKINPENAAGFILIFVSFLSIIISNSPLQTEYISFWEIEISGKSVVHWINDGLMTFFFLYVGLELEHDIFKGELKELKSALFPIVSAIGGMLVPAIIFLFFNYGLESSKGIGIPTATDIAFAIGFLALLGDKVPASLKTFLIALAVVDDLGAILIIALFYSQHILLSNLLLSVLIILILVVLNRLNIKQLWPYIVGGIVLWYFMLHSGIHPTLAGVILAFTIPFRQGGVHSPSYKLHSWLHIPVLLIVMPMFALANTAITIRADVIEVVHHPLGLGVIFGLLIGKPIGIFLFSRVGVALNFCKLPKHTKWKHIFYCSFLAGIGFTISLFITQLAFEKSHYINQAKIAILIASILAAIIGCTTLMFSSKNN